MEELQCDSISYVFKEAHYLTDISTKKKFKSFNVRLSSGRSARYVCTIFITKP